jgi:hypothetical protein
MKKLNPKLKKLCLYSLPILIASGALVWKLSKDFRNPPMPANTGETVYGISIKDLQSAKNWSDIKNGIAYSGDEYSRILIKDEYEQRWAVFQFQIKLDKDSIGGIEYRTDKVKDEVECASFLLDQSGQKVMLTMNEGNVNTTYGHNVQVKSNKWHAVRIELNGSCGKFYIDNKLVETRTDIAIRDTKYFAFVAKGNVSFRGFTFDNRIPDPISWERLLSESSLYREGYDRFDSSKFLYYQTGIGRTNVYVGVDGFVGPASRANRPDDTPGAVFDPNIVYDYWWDKTTRLAPFSYTGGYLVNGKIDTGTYNGGKGQAWSQKLDITTGVVSTRLKYLVNGDLVDTTRDVFVTGNGVVCYRIKSDSTLPFVFQLTAHPDPFKIYKYEAPLVETVKYEVEYEKIDDGFIARSALATDKNNYGYIAVTASADNVSYIVDEGKVVIKPKKGEVFYIFLAPSSDLDPTENNKAQENAINRVATAKKNTYEEELKKAKEWWSGFWSLGQIETPDLGAGIWYVRSMYYQAAALAGARVPAGCFSTNIDGFFGNICFEYDMMLSVFPLQRTGHISITDDIENWIRRYHSHSKYLAQESGLFGNVPDATVYVGLMGYDATPCSSWSLRENWHAIHGGMNMTSFLFRNAAFKGEKPDFATEILVSQLKMLETKFRYDERNGLYIHTGIWSPSGSPDESSFWTLVPGDSLQSYAAVWGLRKAKELGVSTPKWDEMLSKMPGNIKDDSGRHTVFSFDPSIGAISVSNIYGTPVTYEQGSPALIPFYWLPIFSTDEDSLYGLMANILRGSSFTYHFNRAWCAAVAAKMGLSDIAYTTALSMLDTGHVLYDDTYMCESTVGGFDYKHAPELGAHGAFIDAFSLMMLDGDGEEYLKVFPAIPDEFQSKGCSFKNYLAVGNINISASFNKNKTVVTLYNRSNTDITRKVMIRVAPDTSAAKINGRDCALEDGCFAVMDVTVKAGETITLEAVGIKEKSMETPKPFDAIFPVNDAEGLKTTDMFFAWRNSDNAASYEMVISSDIEQNNVILKKNVGNTTMTFGKSSITLPGSNYKMDYWWCVYAIGYEGTKVAMNGGPRRFSNDAPSEGDIISGHKFWVQGSADIDREKIILDIPAQSHFISCMAFIDLEQNDNFMISFRLKFKPEFNYQQAGLYITDGEDITKDNPNWAKFMRVYADRNQFDVYGTDNSWSNGFIHPDKYLDMETVYMKFIAENGLFKFYLSPDGEDWEEIGVCARTFTEEIKVGFAGSTFSGETAYAEIDEIAIEYL